MEDKRISEKESLELIARMIRETQDNAARYAAYPLLIWGYTTVIVSLVVWYFYLQTGMWQINYLWFALPAIAGPLTIFFNRKDKNKGAKNYIDRVTAQIWTVFGVVGFCLSCMAFVVRIDILFVVSLLMGMGATLTGLVCKYKPLSIAGIIGIALSFSMLFIHGSGVYLVNGVHAANSKDLCTKIAREEWGFEGVIMSDWNTTVPEDGSIPWKCVAAGNDIIMPGNMDDDNPGAYNE